MTTTIFEKIIAREIPADILYEDEQHIVFLDIQPYEKGHVLVVPKKPYETVIDMPQSEYETLQGIVHKVSKHIHEIIGGGINIHINNYPIANQEVPHLHVHVIPRTEVKAMYHPENHTSYTSEQERQEYAERLTIG